MVCSALIHAQHFYTSHILVWDVSKRYVVALYKLNILYQSNISMGPHRMVCSILIPAQHCYTIHILVWDVTEGYVVSLYQLNIFIPSIY